MMIDTILAAGAENILYAGILFVAVLLVYLKKKICGGPKTRNINQKGIKGKLIYIDKGPDVKPFAHKKYRVAGKPDFMYKQRSGVLAVEYKSREKNIYQSDLIQAKAAALAARGDGYKVNRILVKTATTEQYQTLPASDRELYDSIRQYIDIARAARQGKSLPADPQRFKCEYCSYANHCKEKIR